MAGASPCRIARTVRGTTRLPWRCATGCRRLFPSPIDTVAAKQPALTPGRTRRGCSLPAALLSHGTRPAAGDREICVTPPPFPRIVRDPARCPSPARDPHAAPRPGRWACHATAKLPEASRAASCLGLTPAALRLRYQWGEGKAKDRHLCGAQRHDEPGHPARWYVQCDRAKHRQPTRSRPARCHPVLSPYNSSSPYNSLCRHQAGAKHRHYASRPISPLQFACPLAQQGGG